jgi:hypothetical protein
MSASQADDSTTPYLDARREWDDRYGALAKGVRKWQRAFSITAVCNLVLVSGFVLLSPQHKVVPYVLQVDEHGQALAMGPVTAEYGATLADERLIRCQLAGFVRSARSVLTDRTALKTHLDQVSAHARGAAVGCSMTTTAPITPSRPPRAKKSRSMSTPCSLWRPRRGAWGGRKRPAAWTGSVSGRLAGTASSVLRSSSPRTSTPSWPIPLACTWWT